MSTSYVRSCKYCGAPVVMTKSPHGDWVALDDGGFHHCNSSATLGDAGRLLGYRRIVERDPQWHAWNPKQWPPDHPLTYRAECWFCGDEIFIHTNGNGDTVLLEPPLGAPWMRHDCLGMSCVTRKQISKKASWMANRSYRVFRGSIQVKRRRLPARLPGEGMIKGLIMEEEDGLLDIVTMDGDGYWCKALDELKLEKGMFGEFQYLNSDTEVLVHRAILPSPTLESLDATEIRSHFPIRPLRRLNDDEKVMLEMMFKRHHSIGHLAREIFGMHNSRSRDYIQEALGPKWREQV